MFPVDHEAVPWYQHLRKGGQGRGISWKKSQGALHVQQQAWAILQEALKLDWPLELSQIEANSQTSMPFIKYSLNEEPWKRHDFGQGGFLQLS